VNGYKNLSPPFKVVAEAAGKGRGYFAAHLEKQGKKVGSL
jgi:hypothetical protein